MKKIIILLTLAISAAACKKNTTAPANTTLINFYVSAKDTGVKGFFIDNYYNNQITMASTNGSNYLSCEITANLKSKDIIIVEYTHKVNGQNVDTGNISFIDVRTGKDLKPYITYGQGAYTYKQP